MHISRMFLAPPSGGRGTLSAVIPDIDAYQEMLGRLEAIEDFGMVIQVDMETSVHMVTAHRGALIAASINKSRFIAGL